MKSEEDEIALQGIEFWSSVCDEEVDLAIEAAEVIAITCAFYFLDIIYDYLMLSYSIC